MNLHWSEVKPINGSKSQGFEELCAQLARAETPVSAKFERKGTPDAGVECFCALSDGSEWGWQAKYVFNLDDSQFQQMDRSVETALAKHPSLARYFVCLPIDRPDARIDGRKSAMERWQEHVTKWERRAEKRGRQVEFVWWGSSELLERLSRPESVGRVLFWFGKPGFDDSWFEARLKEALLAAGPRYTPELHLRLPIAAGLDCFGRTTSSVDSVKARAKGVRQVVPFLESRATDQEAPIPTASVQTLVHAVKAVLQGLSDLAPHPGGVLPFGKISEQIRKAESAAKDCRNLLSKYRRAQDAQNREPPSHRQNYLQDWIFQVDQLNNELGSISAAVAHADRFSNHQLMVLSGSAGTGKTHLLCDFARRLVNERAPTILLMGQRFSSTADPWGQALQQLHVSRVTAQEFVGALEAAAQATRRRALLIIDALNEGAGRTIWPPHLAAFLAPLEASPWIGVLLSIRSTYEEIVIPEEVRTKAITSVHLGFDGHEYDASRTFFHHYGLELPSAPILHPEFRNPLFLKTMCEGLRGVGRSRLPRGFHGITEIFNLYLKAKDRKLAAVVGYDARDQFVSRALKAVAERLVESDATWLTRTEAVAVVNALLPNRDYERSLYRGLVSESVLVEEIVHHKGDEQEEVVFVSYERFADHAIVEMLLRNYPDATALRKAFARNGGLGFLIERGDHVPNGLIEALCIQVPERVGAELTTIVPELVDHWATGDAFLESLVWRRADSISKVTFEVMNELMPNWHYEERALDMLVTVATLPEHRLNAEFLDGELRPCTMPDRDAWWSIYLHHARGSHSAVDRIVDWASDVVPAMQLDDGVDELCSVVLTWMLTTSNRFLRDRATKALICLLTGRLRTTQTIVERFANVNDPYVVERVYAVAYGVAMRSYDRDRLGSIAAKVYELVFAGKAPPAHVLLRDYARGVIERALWLGAEIDVQEELINPPYASTWPTVPSEDEIERYLANWSPIRGSVMGGDFASYVIGTNTGWSNWLSLRLEEPRWRSSNSKMRALLPKLSEAAQSAWARYTEAEAALARSRIELRMRMAGIDACGNEEVSDGSEEWSLVPEDTTRVSEAQGAMQTALVEFIGALTVDQEAEVGSILKDRRKGGHESAPSFDLSQIQRYVLKRVFEFGWTTDKFGSFDRYDVKPYARDASKPERIGKKYQWLAYHEIIAYVSDHYQYRERDRDDEGGQLYQGPWQEHLRDIDPSITLSSRPGNGEESEMQASWWAAERYLDWRTDIPVREWMKGEDDLPEVTRLLVSRKPESDTRWMNLHGYVNWRQPHPADEEWWDERRREVWLIFIAYFVQLSDADAFMKWARGVDFMGRWMPEPPEIYRMFVGEYGWSPAYRYVDQPYYGLCGWEKPEHDCPVEVRVAALDCSCKPSDFDCSLDNSVVFRLVDYDFLKRMKLRWAGRNADFVDECSELAVFDPTGLEDGPPALLARDDLMRCYLRENDMTVCWTVVGEKHVIGGGLDREYLGAMRISGAYVLRDQGPEGFLRFRPEKIDEESTVGKDDEGEKSGVS